MQKVLSGFSGVPIRLTTERWEHITEEHPELENKDFEVLRTIELPKNIYEGNNGELLAVRESEPGKFIVVVYREDQHEGFVITAFYTRRIHSIERRKKIW